MSAVKSIYAGCRALGISDEEDRRDLYERITGKRSLRVMTAREQEGVVQELRRLGFRADGRRQLSGPYAKKLQALWIAAWNLGLVANRDDAALLAFVKRQTGLDHIRFLQDSADATRAVEALKSWLARERGVMWGNTNGHDFLSDLGAKVAWAQWCYIHPDASLLDLDAFRRRIALILKTDAPLGQHRPADWRAVSSALGNDVRRARR